MAVLLKGGWVDKGRSYPSKKVCALLELALLLLGVDERAVLALEECAALKAGFDLSALWA